jgi:hypothetical protein
MRSAGADRRPDSSPSARPSSNTCSTKASARSYPVSSVIGSPRPSASCFGTGSVARTRLSDSAQTPSASEPSPPSRGDCGPGPAHPRWMRGAGCRRGRCDPRPRRGRRALSEAPSPRVRSVRRRCQPARPGRSRTGSGCRCAGAPRRARARPRCRGPARSAPRTARARRAGVAVVTVRAGGQGVAHQVFHERAPQALRLGSALPQQQRLPAFQSVEDEGALCRLLRCEAQRLEDTEHRKFGSSGEFVGGFRPS